MVLTRSVQYFLDQCSELAYFLTACQFGQKVCFVIFRARYMCDVHFVELKG